MRESIFTDLTNTLDPGLRLRVKGRKHPDGRVYFTPEPSVRLGLEVIELMSDPSNEVDPSTEYDLLIRLMGHDIASPLYDPDRDCWLQMGEDGVPHSMQIFAGRTLLLHYGVSPAMAVAFAADGNPGKALPRKTKAGRTFQSMIARRAT